MSAAPDAGKTAGAEESAPRRLPGFFSSPSSVRAMLARQGLAVLIGSAVAGNVLRVGGNLVLTRLLAPEAFGIMGVIGAVSIILAMLSDMGFDAFIIRSHKSEDRRFVDVVWTARLIRAAVLTVLMFLFAEQVAAAFGKPELKAPMMACSAFFLIEGLRSLAPVMALRARRVSYISAVELASLALQIGATLVAAVILKSYWAMVVGGFIGASSRVAFSYLLFSKAAQKLAFDRSIAREMWAFSRVVIFSSTITVILGQADKIFIGRALSLDALGQYMLAVSLAGAGLQLVHAYVAKILLPVYSNAAREAHAALCARYYSARWRMTLVLSFLFGGGVGGGPLLARILFDERYLGAGIFVSILCFKPLFSFITMPAEQAMIALGRMRTTVEANIGRLVWIAFAAPAGFHFFGVVGLVVAFALTEAAVAPYWLLQLRKQGIVNWGAEAAPLAAAAIGALIGVGADRLANFLVASGILPNF